VDHASPFAVVLITYEAEHIFTNNIEAPRMREEQTSHFEVVEHPWHSDEAAALREAVGGVPLGADFPLEGALDVSGEVAPLRYTLDPDALERHGQVGADAAAGSVEPGMSEREAAANLAAASRRRSLFSPVLLAAADDRIASYRHPIPHSDTLEGRAMLMVSAERGGLYANVTRIVHVEEPNGELKRRQEACEPILRRMREEATRPGRTLADAFADCQRFYAEAGFPDEWRLHHQGGMTGYASREIISNPAHAAGDTDRSGLRLEPFHDGCQGGEDDPPHRERGRSDHQSPRRWWSVRSSRGRAGKEVRLERPRGLLGYLC